MASAPSLVVQLPGYPFNNLQSVGSVSALRALSVDALAAGSDIVVDGASLFYWSPGSLDADDGIRVVRPSSLTPLQAGRWIATGDAFADQLETSLAAPDGVSLIGGAVARYPSTPYNIVQAAEARLYAGFLRNFFDTTNNRFIPTPGGGITTGQPNPTLAKPSIWQVAIGGVNTLYQQWKLTGAADVSAKIVGEAAYIRASYTDADLKAGTLGVVINTSDDTRCYLRMCRQFHEVTGNAFWLTALEECLWNTQRIFKPARDPGSTVVSYGASTPGGIPCQSNSFGMLYADETNTSGIALYGYVSSSNEFSIAEDGLYAAANGATTATALRSYARNVWSWGYNSMRRGAPADATRSAQSIYFTTFNLDPNVSTPASAIAPNRSSSLEVYHKGTNAYYGKPIRGSSAEYLGMTLAFGTLSAELYALDGDAKYLTEIRSIAVNVPTDQGFGRSSNTGVRFFCSARDPWSDGADFPDFVRKCLTLPGVDPDNLFRSTLWNTAKSILLQSTRDYCNADWCGREYNFLTGNSTWLEEAAAGYGGSAGGGQGLPNQIMTTGNALAVVIAALMLPTTIIRAIGSGISQSVSIEQLAGDVSAIETALDNVMPKGGGIFGGSVYFGDKGFSLSNGGTPRMTVDAVGSAYLFDRINLRHEFYTLDTNAGVPRREFLFGGNGSGARSRGPLVAYEDGNFLNTIGVFRDTNGSVRFQTRSGVFLVDNATTNKWELWRGNAKVKDLEA